MVPRYRIADNISGEPAFRIVVQLLTADFLHITGTGASSKRT
jgi:hypothetical protein